MTTYSYYKARLRAYRLLFTLFIISVSAPTLSLAQFLDSTTLPHYEHRILNVGNTAWWIDNSGWFFGVRSFGGLWVGALRNRDTLVSYSYENWLRGFFGEFSPATKSAQTESNELTTERSIVGDLSLDNPLAKSDQDVIMFYYDTSSSGFPLDESTGEFHKPLNLRVKQSAYVWSPKYAAKMILLDYEITNLKLERLHDVYLGFLYDGLDPSFSRLGVPVLGVNGFLPHGPQFINRQTDCSYTDSLRIAWFGSPNGLPNPVTGEFDSLFGFRSVHGVKILRPDPELYDVSFNWWISDTIPERDFGPRRSGTPTRRFRDFGHGLGRPRGNKNQYHVLSNHVRDYDQFFTAVDHSQDGWLPPPSDAYEIATGRADAQALLSIGPFELAPGGTLHFTLAVGFGNGFHTDENNFKDNFNPFNPQPFIDNLDFSDLLNTIGMAEFIYDNPGFDTDDDGFNGNYRVCPGEDSLRFVSRFTVDTTSVPPSTTFIVDTFFIPAKDDTIYITGDGVPDFRGIAPPAKPVVRFTPERGVILLDWNGLASETERDIFTNDIDFEGYRVYLGLTKRNTDLTLVASYDLEDFAQWYFNPLPLGFEVESSSAGVWEFVGIRTLAELQIAYAGGRTDYDPLVNNIDNPLVSNDSAFYFTMQDWNQSDLSDTTAIYKIYPGAPFPHTLDTLFAYREDTWHTDQFTGEVTFYEGGELTPDGQRFKYFEYRMILDNLLPSQVYYVSVTAFDIGNPAIGLRWLESNKVTTAIEALAQDRIAPGQESPLDVIVYPNPYRIDGDYRIRGFEGRGQNNLPDDRARVIHFTNLPPVCDVSIYSLDGDLVWTIEHRKTPEDPSAMHDSWNTLSRNLLPIASGIYYWVVETPEGRSQIGKLVVIM